MRSLQVIFHSDALAGPEPYGLARYAGELARALVRLDATLQLVPVALRGRRENLLHSAVGISDHCICPGSAGKAYIAAWAALGAPQIERWVGSASLVHSLELDYPVATRLPWIATIHDLGPLTHPQYFSRSHPWLRRRSLRQLAHKAAAVIAVSEATARELRSLLGGALDGRLHVIHEGVDEAFFAPAAQRASGIPGLDTLDGAPYFLWTGSLNPRKNLTGVLGAFERIAEDVPHHLVLAGGIGWDHGATLAQIEQSHARSRIHRLGRVSDAELRALYAGTDGFVYVSHFEGFGLPVLEAMASGAPVITSDCSSLPEVAGDAALLVDPNDTDAIADSMRDLARDSQLRSDLSARGKQRAATFTWDKCARATLELYRRIS